VLVTLIAAGWVFVFWSAANQQPFSRRYRSLYLSLYALMSREFHVADLYSRWAELLLAFSRRLNGLMRWV
jgi:NADH-quinone oxidoreductase subunit L